MSVIDLTVAKKKKSSAGFVVPLIYQEKTA